MDECAKRCEMKKTRCQALRERDTAGKENGSGMAPLPLDLTQWHLLQLQFEPHSQGAQSHARAAPAFKPITPRNMNNKSAFFMGIPPYHLIFVGHKNQTAGGPRTVIAD